MHRGPLRASDREACPGPDPLRWLRILAQNETEGAGFEPAEAFTSPVFKTGAINHSTTPPGVGTGPAGTEAMISWIANRAPVLKGAATSTPTG